MHIPTKLSLSKKQPQAKIAIAFLFGQLHFNNVTSHALFYGGHLVMRSKRCAVQNQGITLRDSVWTEHFSKRILNRSKIRRLIPCEHYCRNILSFVLQQKQASCRYYKTCHGDNKTNIKNIFKQRKEKPCSTCDKLTSWNVADVTSQHLIVPS